MRPLFSTAFLYGFHGNHIKNTILYTKKSLRFTYCPKEDVMMKDLKYTKNRIFERKVHSKNSPGMDATIKNKEINIFPVVKSLINNIWPKDNPELKKRVAASVVLLIATKIANVSVPFMMKYTIDKLSDNIKLEDLSMSEVLMTGPASCVIAYGVLRICSFGFNELKNAIFAKVAQENIRKTQLEAFKHIHDLDLSFHLSRRTGMISKTLDRGTRSISFILKTLIFNWIPTLFEIALVTAIMMGKCGPSFAIAAISCVSVYSIFTLLVTQWRIKHRIEMNASDNEAGARIIDSLMNYETVKYFNNEKHEYERLNEILKRFEESSLKTSISLAALNFGQSFIFSVSLVSVMLLSAQQIFAGTGTIGDLVMVNGLLFQLSIPLYFFGSLYRDIREAVANLNSLYNLMEEKQILKNIQNSPSLMLYPTKSESYISLKNIKFSYLPEKQILKGLDIDIPYNKKIAIVGGSGSGKSTIGRLLYRFYDPSEGQILINGQDIKSVDLNSLRNSIAVVPQDQVLFHDTIKYNIQYGNFSANFDQIKNAADVSGLHDVIMNFPSKYDTQVGERGLKLSGGEKQRVAIARAILKDSPIFIYDEATSSLDSLMEKKILMTMQTVLKNKTSIVIAHRLSTIIDSDIIYVLKDGKVYEVGSHSDLLMNPMGLYAEMWRKQNDTIYKTSSTLLRDRSGETILDDSAATGDFSKALDEICGVSEKCCKN